MSRLRAVDAIPGWPPNHSSVERLRWRAWRSKAGEKGEVQVLEYASGDYFGELSLLRNQQRAANVKAVTPCVCVTLDRSCFERLLGPVLEILQRNAENYKTYAQIVGL